MTICVPGACRSVGPRAHWVRARALRGAGRARLRRQARVRGSSRSAVQEVERGLQPLHLLLPARLALRIRGGARLALWLQLPEVLGHGVELRREALLVLAELRELRLDVLELALGVLDLRLLLDLQDLVVVDELVELVLVLLLRGLRLREHRRELGL